MPFGFTVDPTRHLAELRASDVVDLPGWLTAIAQARADPAFVAGMPVLVDEREVTSAPQAGEPRPVAEAWLTHFSGSRIAYVSLPRRGIGGEIAILTQAQVRAYVHMDTALEWLMGGP